MNAKSFGIGMGVGRPAACALLGAAFLALAGCQAGSDDEAQLREVPRNVRVLEVRSGALAEYFEVAGTMLPVRGADVSAEEMGTVEKIVRDKGAAVAAGEPILELDRDLLRAELAAAAAKRETEEYNYDKVKQLFDAGKISRIELLQADTAFEQAKARHDEAKLRFERAVVKSPFDGVVADRHVEPGELVIPGTRVARVIDPYVLKLEGYVTEREVAWLTVGEAAEVHLDGVERPATGELVWVGFEARPGSGKFPIEIDVANPDLAYRSGVIGRAVLVKREHQDVLAIPRDAVMPARDGQRVFVVEDGRARMRLVELGPSQGLMVAVTTGLAPGELLVVRGQRDLVDGSLVAITEHATASDGGVATDPQVVRASSARTRVREAAEEAAR
jgi:RND family efflux transporter MFP subunit